MTQERQALNGPSTAVQPSSSSVRTVVLSCLLASFRSLTAAGHLQVFGSGRFGVV